MSNHPEYSHLATTLATAVMQYRFDFVTDAVTDAIAIYSEAAIVELVETREAMMAAAGAEKAALREQFAARRTEMVDAVAPDYAR